MNSLKMRENRLAASGRNFLRLGRKKILATALSSWLYEKVNV